MCMSFSINLAGHGMLSICDAILESALIMHDRQAQFSEILVC